MAKDLSNKTWNNQEKNEGFSGENLPDDYNPAKDTQLQPELETDEDGSKRIVERARDTATGPADNRIIESKAQNRDRNYDHPDRYPKNHPENKHDRGNMKLDED